MRRETLDSVRRDMMGMTPHRAVWAWLKANGIEPPARLESTGDGPMANIDAFTAAYPYHVITTTVGRLDVTELLNELRNRPFSCGRNEHGDMRCHEFTTESSGLMASFCCVLNTVRHQIGMAQSLLGLYSAVLPTGASTGKELEMAWDRVHGPVRYLNEDLRLIDEGLSQFECDEIIETEAKPKTRPVLDVRRFYVHDEDGDRVWLRAQSLDAAIEECEDGDHTRLGQTVDIHDRHVTGGGPVAVNVDVQG